MIYEITKIRGSSDGDEYYCNDYTILLSWREANKLGLNNLKIGDKVELHKDENGKYIKGNMVG